MDQLQLTRLTQPDESLDYQNAEIQNLIGQRGWKALTPFERIGAAYDFVRNEIAFGYNTDDSLPASAILRDGYGQCNTKATLLMALLRALDIPCRLHGFTISKSLQRGVVPELVYPITPDEIVHSWVEVWHDQNWIILEGFILDAPLVQAVQSEFGRGSLCAYGVGTDRLEDPKLDWTGKDTFIQSTGIVRDLGQFSAPGTFFETHSQNLRGLKRMFFRHVVRHWMNRRVAKMRQGTFPPIPNGPAPAPSGKWENTNAA